jgi:hypothetical protein
MNYVIGLAFLAVAVVVALFGDRSVQEKGGIVLKLFSWPKGYASHAKWLIAAALAYAGAWIIYRVPF